MSNIPKRVTTRFLAFWMAMFLLVPPASAAGDLPRLTKGEDYGVVRTRMIQAGWRPYHAPDADRCSAYDARCVNRPEMVACAGTGVGACKFLWKKGAHTRALCTAGETRAVFFAVCEP